MLRLAALRLFWLSFELRSLILEMDVGKWKGDIHRVGFEVMMN